MYSANIDVTTQKGCRCPHCKKQDLWYQNRPYSLHLAPIRPLSVSTVELFLAKSAKKSTAANVSKRVEISVKFMVSGHAHASQYVESAPSDG